MKGNITYVMNNWFFMQLEQKLSQQFQLQIHICRARIVTTINMIKQLQIYIYPKRHLQNDISLSGIMFDPGYIVMQCYLNNLGNAFIRPRSMVLQVENKTKC